MATETVKLAEDLTSKDIATRMGAAERLCQLGEACQEAAVALVRAAGDESEDVRDLASGALEDMGPPCARDVESLAAMLGHHEPTVGYWAATLLGRLGEDAEPAAAALAARLSTETDDSVRQRSAWALGKVGPRAAAVATAPLQAAARDSDARLARLASEALERIAS